VLETLNYSGLRTRYLANRKQFVSIDNCNSSLLEILVGVPQGSILGPLLFLIYINDLPKYSSLFSILFADDTTQIASNQNLDSLITFVNEKFQKTVQFFCSHKLSLHPDKTKFMLITNSNTRADPVLFLNFNDPTSQSLNPSLISKLNFINNSETPYAKFLGVLIDPKLTFKHHVSSLSKKLSTALYFLRTAKNFLNTRALKFLYYSLFHSHLIYAIQIWSCCSEALLKQISLKQKIAIRIISCSITYRASF
jgi:ribonuclease P/MRP protein subunit RPP40